MPTGLCFLGTLDEVLHMLVQLVAQIVEAKQIARHSDNSGVFLDRGTPQVTNSCRPSKTITIQWREVLHGGGTQVPFKHLAQVLQCFPSHKLDDVLHTTSCGGDVPGLHLQVLVTCANVDNHLSQLSVPCSVNSRLTYSGCSGMPKRTVAA
jgi:hypothetical protein